MNCPDSFSGRGRGCGGDYPQNNKKMNLYEILINASGLTKGKKLLHFGKDLDHF